LRTVNRKLSTVNWSFIDDTLKSRMKKNTLANALFFILSFPLMFIVTPMILKYVGKEAFGVWALTGTILVFVELIGGLQASSALSVLVPKFDPKKQPGEINKLVNTLFFFFLSTAALMAAIYFFAEPIIIKAFFKVDPGLLETARFVLGFSVYAFLINFVLLGFGYLMGGFNLFYILSIMHVVSAYLRTGLMVAALFAGLGIKGIVMAQMGVLLLETAVTLIYVKIVFPPLAFGVKYFSMQKLRDLLGLGLKLFVAKGGPLVNANIDKLVLGFFLNPVMAAYYQIGSNISKYITQVPDMLGLFSLLPAAAELKARGMMEKIKVMFDRVNKYVFYLALFLMTGIIIFGREFVRLWVGDGYDSAYVVMMALAAGYTIGLFGYVPMNILNGLERTKSTMLASAVSAGLNITLSAVLTWKFGLIGALAGTLIAITTSSVMLYFFYIRVAGQGLDIVHVMLKPAVAAALGFGLNYLLEARFITGHTWVLFFSKAAVFAAVYFALTVFVFRHFDAYDMDLLKGYIPFLRKK
jgi:O-antigen/teichoic acid export membrane protein